MKGGESCVFPPSQSSFCFEIHTKERVNHVGDMCLHTMAVSNTVVTLCNSV